MKHQRSSYETRIGTMDVVQGRHSSFDRLQTEDDLVASIVKRESDDLYKGALTKRFLSISDEDFEIARRIYDSLDLELSKGEYQTDVLPNGFEKQIDDSTYILINGSNPDRLADRVGYASSGILIPLGLASVIAAPEIVAATTAGVALAGVIIDGASYALSTSINSDRNQTKKVPRSLSHSLGYFPVLLAQKVMGQYTPTEIDRFAMLTDNLEAKEKALRELRERIDEEKKSMTLGDSFTAKRLNSAIAKVSRKMDKLVNLENNALIVTYDSTDKSEVVGFLENVALGEEPGSYVPVRPMRKRKTKVVANSQ